MLVSTIERQVGLPGLSQVATGTLGLLGTAPTHLLTDALKKTVNVPVLIRTPQEGIDYFGPETAGYTIPAALRAWFAGGGGEAVVVNVFDPAVHLTTGTPDVTKVAAADVIGTDVGSRTGLHALRNARPILGRDPKILTVPGLHGLAGVIAAIEIVAGKLRAMAYLDAPTAGQTVTQILTARGAGQAMGSVSSRIVWTYPLAKAQVGATVITESASSHVAAARCVRDREEGFWWSIGNCLLPNVVGTERPILADYRDASCEANLLSAQGVCTLFRDPSRGWCTWGERSAAHPTSSDHDAFECVRRTLDTIEDTAELNSLKYMGKPITEALINQILLEGNAYMRKLQGLGAVYAGSRYYYDPAENPPDHIRLGKLRISYRVCPPPPLAELEYVAVLDLDLLTKGVK